jgi:hypothetical protein
VGREIVYCFKCQRRVLGEELDKGTAYQVGQKITCSSCAVQVLETLPPREKEALLAKMFRETKDRQASPAKAPPPPPTRKVAPTTTRRPAAAPRSRAALLVAGAVVAGLVIAALILRGGAPAATSEDPGAARKQAAAAAIRKARDAAADPDRQVALWQDAVFAAEGTPYLADAKRDLEGARLRQREAAAKELADLEQRLSPLLARKEFKAALDAVEAAAPRRDVAAWIEDIGRKRKAIDEAVAKELAALKEQAALAKRAGRQDEAAARRAQVAAWGRPARLAEFDQALAAVALPTPLADPALVGYWPFDEGSGVTTADSTGTLAARLAGAAWTSGRFGGGLRFDGSGAMVELPSTPALDRLQSGGYTLAAWVKVDANPVESGPDASYGLIAKPGHHMGLFLTRFGQIALVQWLGNRPADAVLVQADSAVHLGTEGFRHVAAAVDRDAGLVRLYVDGKFDRSKRFASATPSVAYGTRPWRIGCVDPGSPDYRWAAKAVVDEVRLYARALTDAEVRILHEARPASAAR